MTKHTEALSETSSLPEFDSLTLPSSPSDDDYDEEPPAYTSAPVRSRCHSRRGSRLDPERRTPPGVPPLNFGAYVPAGATLSADFRITSIDNVDLEMDFLSMLQEQASLPPRPMIEISGTHQSHAGTMQDFHFLLDMMIYFLPRPGLLRLSYIVNLGRHTSSTEGFEVNTQVQRFLNDPARSKRLTLKRTTTNWDTSFLETQILNLLEGLNYRGSPTVAFPTFHSQITISTSPAAPTPANPSPIHSSLTTAFSAPKSFDLEVIWPYANLEPPLPPSSARRAADSESGVPSARRCNVCSESAWWDMWRGVVEEAILVRLKGTLGTEHWIGHAMRGERGPRARPEPWGVDASV